MDVARSAPSVRYVSIFFANLSTNVVHSTHGDGFTGKASRGSNLARKARLSAATPGASGGNGAIRARVPNRPAATATGR